VKQVDEGSGGDECAFIEINRLKLGATGFRGLRCESSGGVLEPKKEIRIPLAAHPVLMRSCMEQSCIVK
jgi:hypothetical protein